MEIKEIDNRYSELAESDCCLSCGGAINYAVPMPGEVCVDLGSGRGTDALRMADRVGSTGFVYGIDIAEGMLEKARKNAKDVLLNEAVHVLSDEVGVLTTDARLAVQVKRGPPSIPN